MRVMIADDEAVARRGLKKLLSAEPDVDVVAEAGVGGDIVRILKTQPVDVLLLDINMPGMSGFDVVEAVGPARMPAVIFVTAYDQHAVAAFDIQALDYLVKPFSEERFRLALDRAREHLQRVPSPALVSSAGARMKDRPTHTSAAYPSRLKLEQDGRVRFLSVRDIRWIEAQDYCVLLHLSGERVLRRGTLKQFMRELDPRWFVRVHRSAAVNVRHVRDLVLTVSGGARACLPDGVEVPVAPRCRRELEDRLQDAP